MRGKGKGRKIFGARITAPPAWDEETRIGGGGNSESALSQRWKERERNGARTESEGAMREGGVGPPESWLPGWGAGRQGRGNRLKYP